MLIEVLISAHELKIAREVMKSRVPAGGGRVEAPISAVTAGKGGTVPTSADARQNGGRRVPSDANRHRGISGPPRQKLARNSAMGMYSGSRSATRVNCEGARGRGSTQSPQWRRIFSKRFSDLSEKLIKILVIQKIGI